jgi:hypothetical protein
VVSKARAAVSKSKVDMLTLFWTIFWVSGVHVCFHGFLGREKICQEYVI